MPVIAPQPSSASGSRIRTSDVSVAFVNNMPNQAFKQTEQQFLGLLESSSGDLSLEVRRFAIAGVPRGGEVLKEIANGYLPIAALWDSDPDVVIVTGTEPLNPVLRDEPYWEDLAFLLKNFVGRAKSILLSCLSAHVALDLFDGVSRTPLPAKCTGVFPQEVVTAHPLTSELGSPLVLPHSRLNDVPERAVVDAGYEVLLRSPGAGWSAVTKHLGPTQLLLLQGHPEYSPSSLLREYRRDLGRYVDGSRDDPPCLPFRCVGGQDWHALTTFHESVLAGRREPSLTTAFPFERVADRASWPWRSMATRLYANWLGQIPTRPS